MILPHPINPAILSIVIAYPSSHDDMTHHMEKQLSPVK